MKNKKRRKKKVKSKVRIKVPKQNLKGGKRKSSKATGKDTTNVVDLNKTISDMRNARSPEEHDKAFMSGLDRLLDNTG